MEKEDKELFRKHARELKKWAKEGGGRCVMVIAGDEEGACMSVSYGSFTRMGETIARSIYQDPDLVAAVKLGAAAATAFARFKEEEKNSKKQS